MNIYLPFLAVGAGCLAHSIVRIPARGRMDHVKLCHDTAPE